MTGSDDAPARVVPSPGPARRWPKAEPARDLGLTPLSRALGPMPTQPRGHWCGRCRGIWYSHLAESRCPVCGTRCGGGGG